MVNSTQYAQYLIARWEGLALIRNGMVYPYICPAGYPTQGYGRRVASVKVAPITREQARTNLLEDTLRVEKEVLRQIPNLKKWPLTLAAITSFTYNLGSGNLSISTLKKRLLEENWTEVVKELLRWKYAGGRIFEGLVARRNSEAILIKVEHGL